MKPRYYYWISVALFAVLLVTAGDGQVTPDDDLEHLLIQDQVDLLTLRNCLSDPNVTQLVEDGLNLGPIHRLEFRRFYEATDGDRVYLGGLRFGSPLFGGARLALLYLYQEVGGDEPQMPPDQLGFRWQSRSKRGTDVEIPDFLSFAFLVHLLQNYSTQLAAPLGSRELVRFDIEHEEGAIDTFEMIVTYRSLVSLSPSQELQVIVTGIHTDSGGFDEIQFN